MLSGYITECSRHKSLRIAPVVSGWLTREEGVSCIVTERLTSSPSSDMAMGRMEMSDGVIQKSVWE